MGVSCGDNGEWRNPEKNNISWENQTPLEKWITAATKALNTDTDLSPYLCPNSYIDWSGQSPYGCGSGSAFY